MITIRTQAILVLLVLAFNPIIGSTENRGLSRASEDKTATAFGDGVYRAVVIGNNDYKDPKNVWRPLNTAINDASVMAQLLNEKYAFSEVKLLKNATRRQILSAMSELSNVSKKEDSVLIFYAGHGWQNPKTQEAFWVPVDAEGIDDGTFISNVLIREKLSVIADNVNHVLLVSDSCFSGSLLNASRGAQVVYSQENDAYFRKIALRKSVQILAAGGSEFVDDDYKQSGHSPFSYFLIKALKDNNDRYSSFSSLAINVAQLVARNVDQTPQSGAMHKAGDEGGQFIFKHQKGIIRQTVNPPIFQSAPVPATPQKAPTQPEPEMDSRSIVSPLPTF